MSHPSDVLEIIEKAVEDMLDAFDVDRPPVPVELMLQRPREGLWPEIDLSEMSATFLNLHDRYAPRMSVVRLLARNVARSPWGQERGLNQVLQEIALINMLARAIIIPRRFLEPLEPDALTPTAISIRFEAPEEDVQQRLVDLNYEQQ